MDQKKTIKESIERSTNPRNRKSVWSSEYSWSP